MNSPRYSEERKRVMVGNLPEDFLRVSVPNQTTSTNGTPHAVYSNQQPAAAPRYANQITICVIQAQLNKNYGLTRMDPYVRVRIGHSIYETTTDIKGGKCPKWNKTITSYLPDGIKTIYIEVFDENTFQPDEVVAHVNYTIPDEAFQGKYIDEWIPLSGKLGVDKEGSINITLSIRSMPYMSTVMPVVQPLMVVPQPIVGGLPYYPIAGTPGPILYQQPMQNPNYSCQPIAHSQPYRPSDDEIKQLQEMFPSYDREVIIGVLENCRGNKEQAISSLLSLG